LYVSGNHHGIPYTIFPNSQSYEQALYRKWTVVLVRYAIKESDKMPDNPNPLFSKPWVPEQTQGLIAKGIPTFYSLRRYDDKKILELNDEEGIKARSVLDNGSQAERNWNTFCSTVPEERQARALQSESPHLNDTERRQRQDDARLLLGVDPGLRAYRLKTIVQGEDVSKDFNKTVYVTSFNHDENLKISEISFVDEQGRAYDAVTNQLSPKNISVIKASLDNREPLHIVNEKNAGIASDLVRGPRYDRVHDGDMAPFPVPPNVLSALSEKAEKKVGPSLVTYNPKDHTMSDISGVSYPPVEAIHVQQEQDGKRQNVFVTPNTEHSTIYGIALSEDQVDTLKAAAQSSQGPDKTVLAQYGFQGGP
jgi:hypothetical protein